MAETTSGLVQRLWDGSQASPWARLLGEAAALCLFVAMAIDSTIL
jgi:hypothetical protein